MVQWIRTRLPAQRRWVRSLVREDPPCPQATKPARHHYRACAPEPTFHKRSHCNEKAVTATKGSPHSLPQEKACMQQRRPSAAKNKQLFFKKEVRIGEAHRLGKHPDCHH